MSWFRRNKTEKVRTFSFYVTEINCVGDHYQYTVEAKNKEEAFMALVTYFFGRQEKMENKIESSHSVVTRPSGDVFETNMPEWFARKINGRPSAEDVMRYEEYCRENMITFQ